MDCIRVTNNDWGFGVLLVFILRHQNVVEMFPYQKSRALDWSLALRYQQP